MEPRIGVYFGESHRAVIREHYGEHGRAGFCPPGLAKKNNGCQPPGQARAWAVGRPLPRDMTYYPLEPSVQVRLGRPPAGYEFVRVASDILLIAVGTSMVMDAIQDLGR
jgi:Ni/Co efflux regulator RcnB